MMTVDLQSVEQAQADVSVSATSRESVDQAQADGNGAANLRER